MSCQEDRWLEVGIVGRPHGLDGALHVRLHNPDSALMVGGQSLGVLDEGIDSGPDGAHLSVGSIDDVPAAIHRYVVGWGRQMGRSWLVKFEGVDQREVAAALTNKRLFVRRGDLPPSEPEEVYQADLVGLSVRNLAGILLGTVLGFFHNGAHEVCVIQTREGSEVLVPFRRENFVDVHAASGVLTLDIPEGIPGLENIDG